MRIPPITTNTPSSIDAKGSGKYPFTDSSSLVSVSGAKLPGPAILDARVYAIGGSEGQYISRIRATGKSVTVTVSDPVLGEIAFGSTENNDIIHLADGFDRPAGVLKTNLGILRSAHRLPFELEFTPQALTFCSSCVIPDTVTGVDGLVVGNSYLSGDVTLVGEDGVVLKSTGKDIKVHIIGDRLSVRRACEAENPEWEQPRPIKRITVNGNIHLLPDNYGNINLTGGDGGAFDNVIRVVPEENGISIKILGNFD